MVFEVGIHLFSKAENSLCYNAKISAVNSQTKIIFKTKFQVIPELFAAIKSKLGTNAEFGSACIALGKNSFDNDDRKMIIKNAISSGFKNAQLIDTCSAKFLNAISSCLQNPQSHNVIWILHNCSGYIWCRSQDSGSFELFTVLKHHWVKGGWKAMNMIPDVIICSQSISHLWKVMKVAFPKCRIFSILDFAYENVSNGALVKAQTMAGNPMMIKYNSDPVLTYSIIKNRQKVIEKNVSLPYLKTVETAGEDIELQVLHSHHHILETFLIPRESIHIIFIDENGIFGITKLDNRWERRKGVSGQGTPSIEFSRSSRAITC